MSVAESHPRATAAYARIHGESLDFYMTSLSATIGRSPASKGSCHVTLDFDGVALLHAGITYDFDERAFQLRVFSPEGLLLNGGHRSPSADPIRLSSQDLISIGPVHFSFLLPRSDYERSQPPNGSSSLGAADSGQHGKRAVASGTASAPKKRRRVPQYAGNHYDNSSFVFYDDGSNDESFVHADEYSSDSAHQRKRKMPRSSTTTDSAATHPRAPVKSSKQQQRQRQSQPQLMSSNDYDDDNNNNTHDPDTIDSGTGGAPAHTSLPHHLRPVTALPPTPASLRATADAASKAFRAARRTIVGSVGSSLHDKDELCLADYHRTARVKPPFTYAMLIADAIRRSPNQCLTLGEIYTYITERYPYYGARRGNAFGWKNSIRHNLSLRRVFIKLPRTPADLQMGHLWKIDDTYGPQLIAEELSQPGRPTLACLRRRHEVDQADEATLQRLHTQVAVRNATHSIQHQQDSQHENYDKHDHQNQHQLALPPSSLPLSAAAAAAAPLPSLHQSLGEQHQTESSDGSQVDDYDHSLYLDGDDEVVEDTYMTGCGDAAAISSTVSPTSVPFLATTASAPLPPPHTTHPDEDVDVEV